MSVRRIFPAFVAGAALVIAACGDDGLPTGTNSGDQPTAQEVDELVAELFESLADLFTGGFTSPSVAMPFAPGLSLSVASVPIDETINESAACDGGGTVSVSGSITGDVDEQAGEGDIHMDVTENVNNCLVVGETTTFTINTDPPIRMIGDFSVSQTSISADFNIGGGFRFTTDDDRSGSCAIDIRVDLSITSQGIVNESVSGSVCNRNINSL